MRYQKILILLFLLASLSGLAWYWTTDHHLRTIDVNGEPRQFLLYSPDKISAKLPLVLVFHGFSGTAQRIRESSQLHEMVNDEGVLLAYMDGDSTWRRPDPVRGSPDVEFFDEICRQLLKDYPIDPDRIYVAGMSMGGDFAIRLGGKRSNQIAAVVSQGMITTEAVEAERPFPLLVIVGTKDDRVSKELMDTVPDQFREKGHSVEVIRPEGIGHWWHVPLNETIFRFLDQHTLEEPASSS